MDISCRLPRRQPHAVDSRNPEPLDELGLKEGDLERTIVAHPKALVIDPLELLAVEMAGYSQPPLPNPSPAFIEFLTRPAQDRLFGAWSAVV